MMRRRLFLASALSAIGLARAPMARAAGAAKAFEEFFFGQARAVYPRYDFAPMTDDEYGAAFALD